MPSPAPDLNLARVLTMLSRPLSAQEREECRGIIARHVRGGMVSGGTGVDQAHTALLAAAAALAGHGWAEAEIIDAINNDRACLDRAGRRRSGK